MHASAVERDCGVRGRVPPQERPRSERRQNRGNHQGKRSRRERAGRRQAQARRKRRELAAAQRAAQRRRQSGVRLGIALPSDEVPPSSRGRHQHTSHSRRLLHDERHAQRAIRQQRAQVRPERAREGDQRQQPPEQRVVQSACLRNVPQRHERDERRAQRAEHPRSRPSMPWHDALAQRRARLARSGGRLVVGLFLVGIAHDGGQLASAALRVAQEGLHLLGEFRDVAVALLAVGVERAEDHVVDRRIELLPTQRWQHELGVLDGRLGPHEVGSEKGVLARQHLIGHRGERPFVATRVEAFLPHLLKRHVSDGAAARRTESRGASKHGQAEVGHLHLALAVDEHVVGLDVQVQNLVVVRHLERMRHRREHGGHHVEREPIVEALEQLGQRDAVHVLHDEVGRGALHLEIVHGHDVGVGQQRRRARLVEAGHARERACRRVVAEHADGAAHLVEQRRLVIV